MYCRALLPPKSLLWGCVTIKAKRLKEMKESFSLHRHSRAGGNPVEVFFFDAVSILCVPPRPLRLNRFMVFMLVESIPLPSRVIIFLSLREFVMPSTLVSCHAGVERVLCMGEQKKATASSCPSRATFPCRRLDSRLHGNDVSELPSCVIVTQSL